MLPSHYDEHADLWEWDLPLASLLFSFLLYGVAEDLGTIHLRQQAPSAAKSCSPQAHRPDQQGHTLAAST